jgi:hypothetical protein
MVMQDNKNKTVKLLKDHIQLWNETDQEKRILLAGKIYSDDIQVIEPDLILNGRDEIVNFIDSLLDKNKGFHFTLSRPAEIHHQKAILSWHFGPDSNPDSISGYDIFTIENGLISSFLVFVNGATEYK